MNMSYCRFRNTKPDLIDCLDSIDDGNELSKEEAKAGVKMFAYFLEFCERYDFITSYDMEQITRVFENLTEV